MKLTSLICAISFTFITSCSFKTANISNGIQIFLENTPQETLFNSFSLSSVVNTPTSTSDFGCFGVNITGSGILPDPRFIGNCSSTDNMRGRGFGIFTRPVSRGAPIEVDVPAGSARRLDVYGVFPSLPECGGGSQSGSLGYFLGGVVKDLLESANVIIPISYSGATGTLTCNGGVNTAVAADAEFGSGFDGDRTITGNITDVNTDSTVIPGRTFSAARRITAVSADGKTLTLQGGFAAADFAVGDELMWMVMGADVNGSCSGTANEIYPGKFGSRPIISVAGNTVTVGDSIVPTPGGAGLGAKATEISNAIASPPFCAIQAIRVPHFNNLTISSGGIVNLEIAAFNYTNVAGGVMVIRVKDTLSFTGGGAKSFSVSEKGFAGATAAPDRQGDGILGIGGVSLAPNGNGGGGGFAGPMRAGGGGANLSAGGAGGNNAGSEGSALTCNTGASTGCIFLGGGGGSGNGAGTGGKGGGILMVFAKNMSLAGGGVFFTAAGQVGAANGGAEAGGGGGGGSIFLKTKTTTSTLTINAFGGDGGNGGAGKGGGGGSGGALDIKHCSGSAPTSNITFGAAGAGAPAGTAGSANAVSITPEPGAPYCTL